MDVVKPGWLTTLESGSKLTTIDVSHVRTGAGVSGVVPLLPWDHMQGLISVLEANLPTLQVLNLNALRIGDVGLSSLVDRVLTKDGCMIQTIDMRHNAITAAGLRQAITKLSVFNFSITTWLLEELGSSTSGSTSSNGSSYSSSANGNATPNSSSSTGLSTFTPSSSGSSLNASSDSSSSTNGKAARPSRPGPGSGSAASKKAEKEKEKESSESREILTMNFQDIVDKYVREFLKLNGEAMACVKGTASHVSLRYVLKHPRLCPSRMAKLVSLLNQAASITLEGWTPPPPLTLKHQEKKLSKLTADQLALKELKRTVPGTLFASLPKLTELKLIKCVRTDIEKAKKGTLRGVFSGKGKEKTSPVTKTTFVPSIPLEVGAMPCLRRLTMSECGLEEITPAALTFMTHVEQIDFSLNEITVIPPQISALSNLTRLFLNSNSITEIPKELSSMRYLRELWLFDNLIQKVPSDIAKWFPVLKDLRILQQRTTEEGLVMEDPELLEFKAQEEDLINSKSTIGCIGFLGMLKLSQATEIVLYKVPKKKK